MPGKTPQFLYVLKLVPRLLDQQAWTPQDETIVDEHFKALQKLQAEGPLILAGRTLNMDPDGMGLVVFKAGSGDEARAIMESDPAVRQGIMTARLYPYLVALISGSNALG